LQSDEAKALSEQCIAPIAACQLSLKENIIKLRKLEIASLKKKQGLSCFKFLCYLARTFQVIKDDYKNCNLAKAVTSTLQFCNGTSLFTGFTADELKNLVDVEFPSATTPSICIIDAEGQTEDTEDITAADVEMNVVPVEFTHELESTIRSCLIQPVNTYNQHVKDTEKVCQLKALEIAITTKYATEQTVLELDKEPTVSATLLNDIIDKKIQAESKKIKAALKNNFRGAKSHTSLNKTTGNKPSGNGKASGKSDKSKAKPKENSTSSLKKSPKYSKPKEKANAKKKKTPPPVSKNTPDAKNKDSDNESEPEVKTNKNKRKRNSQSDVPMKKTKQKKTS